LTSKIEEITNSSGQTINHYPKTTFPASIKISDLYYLSVILQLIPLHFHIYIVF